jgi:hypothetical protein
MGDLSQFIPFLIIQIVVSIAIYNVAKRMKVNLIATMILSLIPVFGMFYAYYFFWYKVFKVLFDRIELLEKK